MKASEYWNFILINLLFFSQIVLIYYWIMLSQIKKDWNTYRCNPVFMPFADNIEENFTYCIQNMQTSYMSYLLEPLNYISSTLVDVGGEFNLNIDSIRDMISVIRTFVTNIVDNIFGVFLNLVTELQKMTISMKDLVGKIIGVVTVLLYVLSGSIQTMESMWAGPPGQMVKALGSGCFHPTTKLQLLNGDLVEIQNIEIGDILKDRTIVQGVIKLQNRINEDFYQIDCQGEGNTNIYVTGEHYMKYGLEYKQVKNVIRKKNFTKYSDVLYNLITNSHRIPIGNITFWDWEDDYVNM